MYASSAIAVASFGVGATAAVCEEGAAPSLAHADISSNAAILMIGI